MDISSEFIIRTLALTALLARDVFWRVTERAADQAKPRTVKRTGKALIIRYLLLGLVLLTYAQLLGLKIVPFTTNSALQVLGFALLILGLYTSIRGRIDLGTNWAHGADYQIKDRHELITTGIYKLIRHPIYSGILVTAFGAQIIAASWLVLIPLAIGPWFIYAQAKREEQLLTKSFGSAYMNYCKSSKRFIPHVW